MVRVFKNEENEDNSTNLKLISTLPYMENHEGIELNPQNLTLFNNEMQVLFSDKQTQSIYDYDLEKGRIVNSYPIDKNLL